MMVIDANVAAKWYLPEGESPKALALLSRPDQLIAPSLIKMEVCAAITRRVRDKEREKRITPAEAKERCESWFRDLREDAVQLVAEDEILSQAIELSVKVRHHLQDCLYLAVAKLHAVPLITADKPFFERAVEHYREMLYLPAWQLN